MANHIAKLNRKNPSNEPVLATSYIRFSPVPERWLPVLEFWKEWEQEDSETRKDFDHLELMFIRRAITDFSEDIAKELGIDNKKISSQITLDEGSLVFEVFFGVFTSTIISQEIIDELLALYKLYINGEEIDAKKLYQVLALVYADIKAIEATVKKIVSSLGGFLKAHIKGEPAKSQQVRFGTIRSLIRFDSSFRRAVDNPAAPMRDRASYLEVAYNQADTLFRLTEEKMMRTVYLCFVILRSKDDLNLLTNLESPNDEKYIDAYNQSMRNLSRLVEKMKKELD